MITKTFYCIAGCESEPYFWYNSREECQQDCGDANAEIVMVHVSIQTAK